MSSRQWSEARSGTPRSQLQDGGLLGVRPPTQRPSPDPSVINDAGSLQY